MSRNIRTPNWFFFTLFVSWLQRTLAFVDSQVDRSQVNELAFFCAIKEQSISPTLQVPRLDRHLLGFFRFCLLHYGCLVGSVPFNYNAVCSTYKGTEQEQEGKHGMGWTFFSLIDYDDGYL